MKKILALVLALTMVFALCACGAEAPAAESGEKTEAPAADGADPVTSAATVNAVKFGFIFLHDENSTYDNNFMQGALAACQEMGIEYVMKTNIPEGEECYETACDMADAGCNIVFADSFGHEDYMIQAAKEYPDVEFCHATGTKAHTEGLSNFHNAFATIFEGRYLAGVVAGLKLNEMIESGKITADQAKIGYVGAFTYAEVISGYTSFFLGARSVCPTATMEVTFTGSWYDEAAEKEGANTLINDGCVLISQHADSMGAPTACETAGIPNVTYNGSTAEACPETYLVSSRIDWTPYFKFVIACMQNGDPIPADWTGTIATGSVLNNELGKNVAEGTAEYLEQVKAELMNGTRFVFDTAAFTVDGVKLDSYMADVDTDPAYTPDTEAIVDGHFAESVSRSAPYFDVTIDGITLLDTAF